MRRLECGKVTVFRPINGIKGLLEGDQFVYGLRVQVPRYRSCLKMPFFPRRLIMSVLMEFSIFPTDLGTSLSESVSQVIKLIDESGLDYQLTPMGTIVETNDFATALKLVEDSHALLDKLGSQRVYGSIKFDIRKDKTNRMTGKIESVENRIGKVST